MNEALACFEGSGLIVVEGSLEGEKTLVVAYDFGITDVRVTGTGDLVVEVAAQDMSGRPLAFAEGATLSLRNGETALETTPATVEGVTTLTVPAANVPAGELISKCVSSTHGPREDIVPRGFSYTLCPPKTFPGRHRGSGFCLRDGGWARYNGDDFPIKGGTMSCPYACSSEVEHMIPVAKGAKHAPAPIPEEGKWVKAYETKDISGLTHGVGWCAPQQGTCKLTLNVKEGVIQEALVETIGCSGMTHSAAMAAEILPGKTIQEALNTDLVCDAINTAMRELYLQIVYGRTQSAFSEGGLPIGAGLEDLGKGLRSQVGTMFSTKQKGVRYLEMAEGYVKRIFLDKNSEVCGYEFVHLGKFMEAVKKGQDANEALKACTGTYGRVTEEQGAVKSIDPRHE